MPRLLQALCEDIWHQYGMSWTISDELMGSLAAGKLPFENLRSKVHFMLTNCQEPGEYMEMVSNVLTKQPFVKPRYTPGLGL